MRFNFSHPREIVQNQKKDRKKKRKHLSDVRSHRIPVPSISPPTPRTPGSPPSARRSAAAAGSWATRSARPSPSAPPRLSFPVRGPGAPCPAARRSWPPAKKKAQRMFFDVFPKKKGKWSMINSLNTVFPPVSSFALPVQWLICASTTSIIQSLVSCNHL